MLTIPVVDWSFNQAVGIRISAWDCIFHSIAGFPNICIDNSNSDLRSSIIQVCLSFVLLGFLTRTRVLTSPYLFPLVQYNSFLMYFVLRKNFKTKQLALNHFRDQMWLFSKPENSKIVYLDEDTHIKKSDINFDFKK